MLCSFSASTIYAQKTEEKSVGAQSGTTGDCKWSFDDNTGTLTISGNGAMKDYDYDYSPWYDYDITTVIVQEGVTAIGRNAFYLCAIKTISLPNTFTKIGDYAFDSCDSLKSITVDSNNKYYSSLNGNLYDKNKKELIRYAQGKTATSFTIPSSVTSIGCSAFSQCNNLTNVKIPNSVTSIGDHAFFYCSKLSNLTVPNSVTSIGQYAFQGCNKLKGLYAQTISAKSFTKTYGAKAFSLGAKAKTKLSYKSSDIKVATVSSAGKVTIKGVGKVAITISAKYTSKYKAATKKITVTVKPKAVSRVTYSGTESKLTVKWSKIPKASGYQVAVSYNKNLKNPNTATVSKNSYKINNKQRKSFYVRIRTFTKYKNVKYYSDWKAFKVKFL